MKGYTIIDEASDVPDSVFESLGLKMEAVTGKPIQYRAWKPKKKHLFWRIIGKFNNPYERDNSN